VSERVVTRLTPEETEAKAAKWRRTALEAVKQSGNPWLPIVETPTSPAAFLERKEPCELTLIGSLAEKGAHLREPFRRFVERHGRLPETLQLWVGPEGDFTPAEVEMAKTAGAVAVTLGRLILRCETAALYGLSVINHELTTSYS
jgi:16S rRNA (uracil1498-N3)-methyltransferase